MTERNDWFRLAGIDAVHYDACDFGLRAGQIASITAIMAAESAATIGQALHAITTWASQHRRQALNALMPAGEFLYTRESAAAWLKLLEEWKASASDFSN